MILFKILTFINKYLPKFNIIILYANLGFRDNVEALYRHLINNSYDKKYKIICVSNNFYSIKKEKNIIYSNLYIGVLYFLFSKYFFYSMGKYPIKPSKNQVVVNLWHGIPIKKIGNLRKEYKNKDYNFFTHLVCFSEFFKPIMKAIFSATDNQLIIAGNLRNDDLFKNNIYRTNTKSILWMPTYRNGNKEKNGSDTLIFNMNNEWSQLNDFLCEKEIDLYIKLHPLEESLLKFKYKDFSNIFIINDEYLSRKNINLYSFIGSMDSLITDYSSVYFDYLLLDKPIGFVVDDYAEYSENRGFIFENILNYMPGEKIYSFDDLKTFIDKIHFELDDYKKERRELNDLVNEVKSDFCENLLNKINLKVD